jgi:antitoxin component of MazEF toxin-antitoxin module
MENTKIRRIGNGRGILLSKSLCNLIGMGIEDRFKVEIEDGRLVLIPIREV